MIRERETERQRDREKKVRQRAVKRNIGRANVRESKNNIKIPSHNNYLLIFLGNNQRKGNKERQRQRERERISIMLNASCEMENITTCNVPGGKEKYR